MPFLSARNDPARCVAASPHSFRPASRLRLSGRGLNFWCSGENGGSQAREAARELLAGLPDLAARTSAGGTASARPSARPAPSPGDGARLSADQRTALERAFPGVPVWIGAGLERAAYEVSKVSATAALSALHAPNGFGSPQREQVACSGPYAWCSDSPGELAAIWCTVYHASHACCCNGVSVWPPFPTLAPCAPAVGVTSVRGAGAHRGRTTSDVAGIPVSLAAAAGGGGGAERDDVGDAPLPQRPARRLQVQSAPPLLSNMITQRVWLSRAKSSFVS